MRPPSFGTELERYLSSLRRKERTQRHIDDSARVLRHCFRQLKEIRGTRTKYLPQPITITQDELIELKHMIPGGPGNRKYQLGIMMAFLHKCGNPLDRPLLQHHIPDRPRLTMDELDCMMSCLNGWRTFEQHQTRIMVMTGLLTARRKMALGMTPGDIHPTYIRGIDKGPGGGRERVIPINPEIFDEYQEFLEHRRQVIRSVKQISPDAPIPDKLFIWTKYERKKMGNLTRSSLENRMHTLSDELGFRVTFHMLRRAGCEMLIRNGTPVPVAMRISDHSTEAVFRHYVGELEDLARDAVRDSIYQPLIAPKMRRV